MRDRLAVPTRGAVAAGLAPYAPAERYDGRDNLFGSRAVGGLPVWAERDPPVRNRDPVV